jgi:hypothetical protein
MDGVRSLDGVRTWGSEPGEPALRQAGTDAAMYHGPGHADRFAAPRGAMLALRSTRGIAEGAPFDAEYEDRRLGAYK